MAERDIPKPTLGSTLSREHSTLEAGNNIVKPEPEFKKAVIIEKKSFGTRLRETFIADDARDVGDYILWDILVPTIKRTIRDIIVGSADRIFLGVNQGPSYSNGYGSRPVITTQPRTNYSGFSATRKAEERLKARPETRRMTAGNGFMLDSWSVPVTDRDQLVIIMDQVLNHFEEYEKISVDMYYQIVQQYYDLGFEVPYTAKNWGWKNLATMDIVQVPGGGYMLKMPTPISLKG